MLKDVDYNKIDMVIANDLSMIGRHNAQTLLFIEDMKKKVKMLIAIGDNYDSEIDDDDITGIKAWYNERYVKDTSKKIKAMDPKGFTVKTPNKQYHTSVVGSRLRGAGPGCGFCAGN